MPVLPLTPSMQPRRLADVKKKVSVALFLSLSCDVLQTVVLNTNAIRSRRESLLNWKRVVLLRDAPLHAHL